MLKTKDGGKAQNIIYRDIMRLEKQRVYSNPGKLIRSPSGKL